MVSNQQVGVARCVAVGAGATLGCGLLSGWLLPIATTGGAATFDVALVRLCAGLAAVAAGWLWCATVRTVVAGLRGRCAGGVPAPLRRVVLAACGLALTGGLAVAGPAHATPGRLHEDRVARSAAAVAGLPLPERAVAAPARRRTSTSVVVAPGDTLWAIAARTLGPGAGDAQVDARWRRVYDLNRAEIGPDPDLIRPAQRLEVQP